MYRYIDIYICIYIYIHIYVYIDMYRPIDICIDTYRFESYIWIYMEREGHI